jgi:hypothetical protein
MKGYGRKLAEGYYFNSFLATDEYPIIPPQWHLK